MENTFVQCIGKVQGVQLKSGPYFNMRNLTQ